MYATVIVQPPQRAARLQIALTGNPGALRAPFLKTDHPGSDTITHKITCDRLSYNIMWPASYYNFLSLAELGTDAL